VTPSEIARLAALREYGVLDTPPEAAFDRITELAAELFDAPIALVSLVDAERQWFKSAVGLGAPETPREYAFCDHTIRSDEVMVVTDALLDRRFRDNPLVLGEPEIRFYAGAPLTIAGGHRLGSLCIIDRQPRELDDVGRRRLAFLANVVVGEMNLRLANQQLALARRQAEAAAEARAEFLFNMSHELRTPLTSIIGFSGILGASRNLPERERHFVQRINAASQALLAIVNDVLDIARLDSGEAEDQPVDLADVRQVAEAAVQIVEAQAGAKGLDLRLEAPERLPPVRVAPARLRQVLLNLLGNAVKFTEAGHVVLSIEAGEDRLKLRVADTGVGIPADRLEQIFQRFVQADSTVARRYGGTGLGLAISHRLAERMGGELTVESEVGRGSVFTLALPLA
jgi:signal transduction histidine kinase